MRSVRAIVTVITLLLSLGALAACEKAEPTPPQVVKKQLDENTGRNGIRVLVKYPQFEHLADELIQQSLNLSIESAAKMRVEIFKGHITAASAKWVEPLGGSNLAMGNTIVSMTPQIVSIRFDVHEFIAGEAQPNNYFIVFNYDLGTNKKLALEDVFSGDYLVQLKSLLDKKIAERFEKKASIGVAYQKLVKPDEKSLEIMVIDMQKKAITFTIDPHQVGRNRLDPIMIDLSFEELRPLLRLETLKGSL